MVCELASPMPLHPPVGDLESRRMSNARKLTGLQPSLIWSFKFMVSGGWGDAPESGHM